MSQQPVIYLISWTNNNYFYIGQAQKLSYRKNVHLHTLKNKKHCNKKLQNVYNKYGVPNFHIIEDCEIEELNQREQFYLDLLFHQPECLNIAKDAFSPMRGLSGKKRPEHVKEIMKKVHVGAKRSEETKRLMSENRPKKKVLQCTLDETIIKEWKSITAASKALNISKSSISACALGKKNFKTAGGFIWKFKSQSSIVDL